MKYVDRYLTGTFLLRKMFFDITYAANDMK